MLLIAVPMSVAAAEPVTKDAYIAQMGYATNAAWTKITTAAELEAISNTDAKNYYLANDIVIEGDLSASLVGDAENKGFKGVFDGCGFSITMTGTFDAGAVSIGLFCTNFEGTMKNVTFGSATAPIKFKGAHANYGIIANQSQGDATVIENVNVYADIDSSRAGATNIGLLIGKVNSGKTTFKNCHAVGSIKIVEDSLRKLGGLVGANVAESVVEDCSADVQFTYGTVGAGSAFGGIIGFNTNADCKITMKNCVNYCDLAANENADIAGFIGKGNVGTVTVENCINLGEVGENGIVGGGSGIMLSVKKCVSVSASDIKMIAGASVKIDAPTAIRFGATLGDNLNVATLKELVGEENVKLGVLIAPTATVAAATAFTKDALAAGSYTDAQAELVGKTLIGKSADILEADYKTSYSGVAYVSVKIDGEWITVYGAYDAANARTVDAVAKSACEDLSDAQSDSYANAAGDKFSPYTAEQLTSLKNYYEVAN